MKHFILLFLFVSSSVLNTVYSQACLSNYSYRVPITVTNPNASVLNNFQVKVTLNTQALIAANKLRIDGGDIRFTNAGGTNLVYWYDPATFNTTSTEIWVKVDAIAATPTTTSIYLFYGNATDPFVSSGDATFELFDDFQGTSLNLSKWTRCGDIANVVLSGGNIAFTSDVTLNDGLIFSNTLFPSDVIVEADVVSALNGSSILGFTNTSEQGYVNTLGYNGSQNLMKLSRVSAGTGNCLNLTNVLPSGTGTTLNGVWSFEWPSASSQIINWPDNTPISYSDGFYSASVFSNNKQVVLGSHLNSTYNGALTVDWIRVRKWAALNPYTDNGLEQEYPVNPDPTNSGPYCGGATVQFNSNVYAGATYSWTGPLGFTSTIPNPTIVGSVPANTGTYTLSVAVPGCPPVVSTTLVDVSQASVAGITSGSTTVCEGANGGTVTVSAYTGNVMRWEMANSPTGPWYTVSNTASTITYGNLLQTHYFRPIVKTLACPEAVGDSAIITVDEATVGGFVIGGTSVCSGTNSGTLNLVYHNGDVQKWQQSIDGGTTWTDIISNSTSYNFSNLTTTTLFRAQVQNGFVCGPLFSDYATVVVNPLPVPSFSAATVCEDVPSTFVNSSTIASGTISNYQWDFGNGNSSISSSPIYYYPTYGSYLVELTAVSAAGCTAATTGVVTVNPKPIVNFTAPSVCQGQATTFQALVTVPGGGFVSSYFWDHDDATTETLPNHTYTYSNTGLYNVLLVATTNNGCIDSLRNYVEVAAPVNVQFITDSVCLGQSISFVNTSTTSSPNVAYSWSFGNGDNSTVYSPTYTYSSTGSYNVTLTAQVIGSPSACVSSTQEVVVIYEVPSPNFSYSNVCLVDSAMFTNLTFYSGNPTNITYNWTFGDATVSNSQNPNHLYGSPNNYNVALTATTIEGCTATSTQLISIYPMPIANFSFADVCLNENMNFTSSSSISAGTITYSWDFDDAGSSVAQNPVHLYNADNSYNVELIVTSNNSCRDTIVKTVVVHPLPFVDFLNSPVCDGQPSSFQEQTSINNGNVVTFFWDFGDGSSSVAPALSYQYMNPGTYQVNLIATSDNGCVHDTTKTVVVNYVPVANFTAQDACLNSLNQFTNTSTITGNSPLTYNWDFGDSQVSSLTSPGHLYNSSGLYNVKLIVTSGPGCVDSVVKVTEVYALPVVYAGNDTTISRGDEVQLNGYAPYGVAYSWTPVSSLSVSNIPNPVARPMDSTTYTLTMTDYYGCQNTDDIVVMVLNDFKLLIYNVITPDANGQNDYWKIENIDFYPEALVQVFNRWGELVFETSAYQSDWQGTKNNDQLPDGTYYYIISFPTTDFHYKGSVTLLRNK